MPILLLTTVGTSLFTNHLDRSEHPAFYNMTNKSQAELNADETSLLERARTLAMQGMEAAQGISRKDLSAEINGILSLKERDRSPAGAAIDRIHHLLIATDTAAGGASAALVEEWLEKQGEVVEKRVPHGLQTGKVAAFRVSAANMAAELKTTLDGYRKSGYELVFNLTGGFKGANAFLQTLALICGASTIYIFETSRELLEVPSLPVRLASREIVKEHEMLFRRLGMYRPVSEDEVRASGMPLALAFFADGQAMLSEFGTLVWADAKDDLARSELLAPSHARIRYSDKFCKDARDLKPDRRGMVNHALDEFAKWLDEKQTAPMPKSNTFKPIQGNPVPPSTHELYAWSDGETGRIFMHEDSDGWIMDKIGAHLQ